MRDQHQGFFYSLFFARLADEILLFLVPLVIFQTTKRVSWSGIAFSLERPSRDFSAFRFWVRFATWLIALSALCGMLTSQGLVAREVMLPQIFSSHRFEKVLPYSQCVHADT